MDKAEQECPGEMREYELALVGCLAARSRSFCAVAPVGPKWRHFAFGQLLERRFI